MFKSLKLNVTTLFAAIISVGLLAGLATAGSGGTEFTPIVTTLIDWAEGGLGKTIILAMFITGVAVGVLRQSLFAAVVGIAGALVMNYGPGIIDSTISASPYASIVL